ncbi:gliding motility lipoprotein GldH [Pedobacter psychrophilus]|uniref:Gliding motility lipoprotein GldH n=1 Tax=Pedobacter psychrophilus TaxID=1826909 RepID=A0A179DEP2_9SPHI|nr:gliding motility lipoprotein GldH [Pedobacter psychrophilus]OAQ39170.1 gliding motility lipoprotein GldH [Pedobacter psychrophilus]
MKILRNFIFLISIIMGLQACDNNVLVDTFDHIPNENWTYIKPIKAVVNITDSTKKYNIYVNFRHTADYKYANIWLRFHLLGPKLKDEPLRQEFQLAMQDGEWLGNGSGNLYSYQLIYKENYKFPTNGKYTIVVEQNMRDNPLKNVSDAGVRIVLAE